MFQLDLTSHKSIYEQVVDKFKELIMTDVLPCDAKLPSVRELSGMLSFMFQLDLTSHKSIYEQVVDKFKELIMTDVLPCDAKLPSVRELSGMLSINPNTVQKAYRELEREGFCYSAAGRGTFVSDRSRIRPDSRRIEESFGN